MGSSIVARWLPALFKDNLDFDAVEGAAGVYSFPNVLIDYVREEPPPGLSTGWWRGVGTTHNAFMVEGFVDELAAAAGKDPVEYRRVLLDKAPRARAVLDLAADKAGWSTPPPAGVGRGIAVVFGFGSYIAQVAEVSVGKDGAVKVHRIVCAVDCGQTARNPRPNPHSRQRRRIGIAPQYRGLQMDGCRGDTMPILGHPSAQGERGRDDDRVARNVIGDDRIVYGPQEIPHAGKDNSRTPGLVPQIGIGGQARVVFGGPQWDQFNPRLLNDVKKGFTIMRTRSRAQAQADSDKRMDIAMTADGHEQDIHAG